MGTSMCAYVAHMQGHSRLQGQEAQPHLQRAPEVKGHPDPTGPGPFSTAQPGLILAASFVPLCWAVEGQKLTPSRLAAAAGDISRSPPSLCL